MAELTAQEQYLLELVNRARLDPAGEAARNGIGLNDGLASGTITADSKQPLASNGSLATAAQGHSQWMLDTDTFSHTGSGGSNAGNRMSAAGYSFTGSWSWGENISWRGTTGTLNLTTSVGTQHSSLFQSPGHRENILDPGFREIGVGVRTGVFQGYNASMVTENFARSGTGNFLTGVAYFDADGDKFYTVGEGRGGIRMDARNSSGALVSTTTAAAGGYQTKLAAGTYDVTFSGGGLSAALGITLAIASENIKLDVMGTDTLGTNVSATLGANTRGLVLLGIDDVNATGNSLANSISGNKGANQINGGAGSDTLSGGAGNDVFILKAGQANGDVITDFTGNGSSAGDTMRFEGYGTGATLTNVSGNQWRVSGGGFTETITITGAVASSDVTFDGSTSTLPGGSGGGQTETGGATAGADTLAGTTGGDTIDGLAGNDRITGDAGDDRLTGSDGNDTLLGGTGNDVMIGGLGADSMAGSSGNDTYGVDATTDRVTEASGGGADTVQSSITYTLGSYVENLTLLAGAGSINGTGNSSNNVMVGNEGNNSLASGSGNDSLTGAAGADTLNGGSGNDTMIGGAGNDYYYVGSTGDLVSENSGEGTDTVQAGISYTLGANLENLILSGSSGIGGTGNTGNNLLTGNAAANSLSGSSGNDTLRGAGGNDVLNGGTGSDTFWRATASDGRDTIQDFTKGSGGDRLDIGDVLSGYDSGDNASEFVQLVVSGSSTIVRIDANGAVGGASFADAFVLTNVTGLSVNQMIADGNLVLS
jgi:Ca2+-binding RTX toxin-like protein